MTHKDKSEKHFFKKVKAAKNGTLVKDCYNISGSENSGRMYTKMLVVVGLCMWEQGGF